MCLGVICKGRGGVVCIGGGNRRGLSLSCWCGVILFVMGREVVIGLGVVFFLCFFEGCGE